MRFLCGGERRSLTLPETPGRCFLNRHEAQESWEMLLVGLPEASWGAALDVLPFVPSS